uniref:Uncharacterized protein n=1 Tax=Anguilla anguilla TaxID=7936 RepID=A0A0E9TZY7_ANGAN
MDLSFARPHSCLLVVLTVTWTLNMRMAFNVSTAARHLLKHV